jgi:hypothetical protein
MAWPRPCCATANRPRPKRKWRTAPAEGPVADDRDPRRAVAPEAGRCPGERREAAARRAAALPAGPRHHAYDLVEALHEARLPQEAIKVTEDDLLNYPSDPNARPAGERPTPCSASACNSIAPWPRPTCCKGNSRWPWNSWNWRRKAGDGNFYEQSQVDSRLRELKKRMADEAKEAKRPGNR